MSTGLRTNIRFQVTAPDEADAVLQAERKLRPDQRLVGVVRIEKLTDAYFRQWEVVLAVVEDA